MRSFEDFQPGDVLEFGSRTIEKSEIIGFGNEFDPQPFHIDPDAASHSIFGGLIASGWHTASLTMRMFVDHVLSDSTSLGSPGVDELRWTKPVRPGDTLKVRMTVIEAQRSRSRPDRGAVRSKLEVLNQAGETVMTMIAIGLFRLRAGRT